MSECDDAGKAEMDQLMRTIPPMDATAAAALLREAKEVFDELGIVFFLRQGTCLGAVRDGAFIPWDDDIDLGSIYGMHGLTKRSAASMAEAFRARGFHVEPATYGGETWLGIMKHHIRIDWFCYRVHKGHVFHFPNVSIPVELFARLQEIDFVGERFLVPSPPEEYLRCKYGPNWATPKRIGYEKDVVDNLPAEWLAWTRRLRRFLAARLAGRMAVLQVLGRMARQSRTPKSPWRVWAGAGRTATAMRGAMCLVRTCMHWSCGRRDGKRCCTRSSLRPVGGTCTGPMPSGQRGVSSCSQRSADGRGLDPSPLR